MRMNHEEAISLSRLNLNIKQTIRGEFSNLVWVTAEINQFNQHSSGHCYLELIEKASHGDTIKASIRANIWASAYSRLSAYFKTSTGQALSAGIKVLVRVQVDFHEVYGISLNIRDIDPNYTLGDMARKRQEIIKKLDEAGVTEMNKELELSRVPQRIAVISSSSAAGYEDFCEQLKNNSGDYRFYWKLFPARMQGEQTSASIIGALDLIADYSDFFEAVVIIRGGGSKTDLSFFDDFDLAYNIAQFPLPILTGIGHERDESICDMVAHTSCKTPTAVAEFLIDVAEQFEAELDWLKEQISRVARKSLNEDKSQLQHISKTLSLTTRHFQEDKAAQLRELMILTDSTSRGYISALKQPLDLIEAGLLKNVNMFLLQKQSRQREIFKSIDNTLQKGLSKKTHQLALLEKQTQYMDPFTILKRGYSISYKEGKPIKDPNDLKTGDEIETRVHSGVFKSKIN